MKLLFIFSFLLCVSCQTVTISDSKFKSVSQPNYEKTQWFFLWGITPSLKNINLRKACEGKRVAQMQTQYSFVNQVVKYATLGIVYPRTAKVWCK